VSLDLHVPMRSNWLCRACQDLWPCAPARGRLLAEYLDSPTSLKIYMTDMRARAAFDLVGLVSDAELDARMFGWLPR